MKNVFYFWHINAIGGIESFFYYLARKYKDWDITIYYKTGDEAQIRRLKQYVRVKKYNPNEKIVCDRAFFNFNLEIIDNVEAKEYIQIAHGDYKAMGIAPNTHPKITKYLGVSKQVCDTFKEVTGYDTELVYNPIEIEKPKKVLNLISATRLTHEKGKERMIKLAELLDKAEIPYIWTIFTNDTKAIDNPNVVYMKPRLDIIPYIANADYLVQLSDNEGYCYSVIESLCVGTPVIVTNCPVFKELGIENGKNGFIVNFDMKNVPIQDIYKGLPKFTYKPKESNWDKFLLPGESTYEGEEKALVRATSGFIGKKDAERNIYPKIGEEWETSLERAEYLKSKGAVEIVKVIVEKPKKKKKIEDNVINNVISELRVENSKVDTIKKPKK